MYRDRIRLLSRQKYAYLAIVVVAITVLSGLSGILASNGSNNAAHTSTAPQASGTTYETLAFFETGLPTYSGSTQFPWSINVLNSTLGVNTTASTSGSMMNFSLPIGTYTYTVGSLPNFTASPSSAKVVLNEAFVSINLNFIASIYSLSFKESGLPYSVSGSASQAPLWKVTVSNATTGLSTTSYSTGTSLMFQVPNVNIHYNIASVDGYYPTPSVGNVLISNGTYIINVQFSDQYSYISFQESGLFSNTSQNKGAGSFGMHWSMTVTSTALPLQTWTKSSDSSSIKFWLPVGSYTYTASSIVGFGLTGGTGTVTLPTNKVVDVTYTAPTTLSQATTRDYTINLYEVGLQPGTSWSLAITNSSNSATSVSYTYNSAIILAQKPNGTYYVRVLDSGTMTPSPANFEITVDGANATATVHFSSSLQWLNLTEKNLNAGQQWGVIVMNLNNVSTKYTTIYRDLNIQLPNGSYFYRVVALSNYVYPLDNSSGFIDLSTSIQFNISFTAFQYLVKFTETALPAGTSWSLLLNEPNGSVVKLVTNQASLSTYLPNGTYLYVPSTSNSYRASPLEGTFHIGGNSNNELPITFISNLHSVSFVQTGLPSGRFWNVIVTDGSGHAISYFSKTSYINLSLLNGTYTYRIYNSSTYVPAPNSGTIIVSGTPVVQNVKFTRYAWNLVFNETGLSGIAWNITVTAPNGTVYANSTVQNQVIFNLTNGTYAFTIRSANNTWESSMSSGNAVILGASTYVNVTFVRVTYTISFRMSGLTTGTVWGVKFDGVSHTTNTTYINLTVTNGTYNYTVNDISGYTVAPVNGTLHISGKGESSTVTYTRIVAPPPPSSKTSSYSIYVVVGVLVGLGAVGLGIVFILYYQRRKT